VLYKIILKTKDYKTCYYNYYIYYKLDKEKNLFFLKEVNNITTKEDNITTLEDKQN
jgi:hypothetical protein